MGIHRSMGSNRHDKRKVCSIHHRGDMGVQHICIHNHKSKDIRNGCRGEQGQPLHRPLARHQQISCHSKRMGGHSESRHGSRCMEHSCRRMEPIHGIHTHVHKVQSSTT